MSDTRYNGWTNYETWVVNLWMDNEEGSRDYWLEVANDIYNNEAEHPAVGGLGLTRKDDAIYLLADRLKDYHEDAKQEILERSGMESSVWADLMGSALCMVNWREIAEGLLENVGVVA